MTLRIVRGDQVVRWAIGQLGYHPDAFGLHAIGLGIERDGRLCAGVVYCMNNGRNLHAHIASDGSRRWMTRDFRREMFAVPFAEIGVARITATTPSGNNQAIAFLLGLGFELEARLSGAAADGSDLLVFAMFRERCPWLGAAYTMRGKMQGVKIDRGSGGKIHSHAGRHRRRETAVAV